MKSLSNLELQYAVEAEIEARKRGLTKPLTFRQFVDKVKPRYKWYRHCEILADVLQRIADGELKRVMVLEPPRHGKSEEVSRLFSAYYTYRFPERWTAIASYGADLAYTLSRSARENYTEAGGIVSGDASAVKHWETNKGGGFWACGVGGPATGKGFHLGIIDDPIKDAEQAESEVIRAKQKDWWTSTWTSRAEPDAAMIVIQTRWHEDDLTGWLLKEEEGDDPEHWHIVYLPGIYENLLEFPRTCTIEPDFRQEGEALCPERYSIEYLRKREAKNAYWFSSLFQQSPTARTGNMIKVDKIKGSNPNDLVTEPSEGEQARGWDLGGSNSKKADRTAGVRGKVYNGKFYICHEASGQWSPNERNGNIRRQTDADQAGQRCKAWIERPIGLAVEIETAMSQELLGTTFEFVPSKADKVTRADPFAAAVEAGNVCIVRTGDPERDAWIRPYLDELAAFPFGKHDDRVDATTLAFTKLTGPIDIYSQWLND